MTRFFLGLLVSLQLWAQYSGLATPYDGSVVYFASTLKLKGTNEPDYGKLFVADGAGVRLFRSREEVNPAPPGYNSMTCLLGLFYAFGGAQVTSDSRMVAAPGLLSSAGYCRWAVVATDLITARGERVVHGRLYLSPDGRYAIVDTTTSPYTSATLEFLDLRKGTQIPVPLPAVTAPYQASFPYRGRAIANDGTAVFSFYNGTYIVRPGQQSQQIPIGPPLAIDAAGRYILYSANNDVRRFDLATRQDQLVIADGSTAIGMSDDAGRVLLWKSGQAYTIQGDGTGLMPLPADPAGITGGTLSGNGHIAYLTTAAGRLLRANVGTGEEIELVGRTPYIGTSSGPVDAGFIATVNGTGFSDVTLNAAPPLPLSLGNVTVRIAGRAVPIQQVTPTAIQFLVPWDVAPASAAPVVVETHGVHSPFDFPSTTLSIGFGPRAGVVLHQDWNSFVANDNPAHAGEIIHVWAVGLGPVNPEVLPGQLAPSTEPLARLTTPMTCDNGAQVLYAGLAPGKLERTYQVDIRLGSVTGYLKFSCSAPSMISPLGLTIYIVP